MKKPHLAAEWSLLQNQFDSYEKYSLLIKLANITILATAYFTDHFSAFILCLLLILWLQDAIWKTFQSRIDVRLLQLEAYLANEDQLEKPDVKAYQFNSLYLKYRPSSVGLIKEYLSQALRPTIAFPHLLLIVVLGFKLFFIA
ncbi:hypothetical protein A9Q88_10500 [Gammaproteobacteria bacterium 50_400_T64]|nr:hypothetical protein A9Q88_10500 [Gammaproteobacteria bacterium 50_400_T64]